MKLHLPKEVWIFGKGPSLDYVRWEKIGDFRIGINHAAYRVPNLDMVFANDAPMQDELFDAMRSGYWSPFNIVFVSRARRVDFPYHLVHTAEGRGTAGYAVSVLIDLGVKHFHFVGFDSMFDKYGYARGMPGDPVKPEIYTGIIEYIERRCEEMGIRANWHE